MGVIDSYSICELRNQIYVNIGSKDYCIMFGTNKEEFQKACKDVENDLGAWVRGRNF
jgi:hypothetical protein